MRIKKLAIKKLFGMFDHVIPLNDAERITIIHGPNGVGKTTILRLVSYLASMQLRRIAEVPFERLSVYFGSRKRLRIDQRVSPDGPGTLKFTVWRGREKLHGPHEVGPERDVMGGYRELAHGRFRRGRPLGPWVEEYLPWVERIGGNRWFDSQRQDTVSLGEICDRYAEYLPSDVRERRGLPAKWLQKLLRSLDTHIIETQRLSTAIPERRGGRAERKEGPTTTVEGYADDMAERIQETLRESGVRAASLDRTFPSRLLRKQPPKGVTDGRIRKMYREQSAIRERLMVAGLIAPEDLVQLPERKLQKTDIRVLWHYLKDVSQKLSVFDALLEKVELFKDIINTRFRHKTFAVDKVDGFVFTNANGVRLPARALSSGEQHEVVLAYQLIFKVEPGSLILIDEPELSLHVSWQHRFLDDMERISKLADLDFLVATHSPSIIHERRHLMVPLEGPKE